jgi:hypothetical protein
MKGKKKSFCFAFEDSLAQCTGVSFDKLVILISHLEKCSLFFWKLFWSKNTVRSDSDDYKCNFVISGMPSLGKWKIFRVKKSIFVLKFESFRNYFSARKILRHREGRCVRQERENGADSLSMPSIILFRSFVRSFIVSKEAIYSLFLFLFFACISFCVQRPNTAEMQSAGSPVCFAFSSLSPSLQPPLSFCFSFLFSHTLSPFLSLIHGETVKSRFPT